MALDLTKYQTVQGHKVKVFRRKNEKHLLLLDSMTSIPLVIAKVCCGKDAWITETKVKCEECGIRYKLKDSESEICCQDCWDEPCEDDM